MTETSTPPQGEVEKRRRQRSLAIGGSIVAFIVVIYLVTLLRIGAAASGAGTP